MACLTEWTPKAAQRVQAEDVATCDHSGEKGASGISIRCGTARSTSRSALVDEDEVADEIIQAHPRSSLQQLLGVTDPEKWARTSFKLAKTHVPHSKRIRTTRRSRARPTRTPRRRSAENRPRGGFPPGGPAAADPAGELRLVSGW